MEIVKTGHLIWIDIHNAEPSDITFLQENFDIHPLAIEELTTPTYHPKVVQFDGCLFLSVHIPLFDTVLRTTYPGELDIILTRDALITSHKHAIYQLSSFLQELSGSRNKREQYFSKTPAHLLYHVLDILLNSCFPRLRHVMDNLDHIETQVFAGHEKEMVLEISVVKRDVLNFRRTLKPQRSILESLSQKEHPFIPHELKLMIGTNIRIWNILESAKETVEALEATNNSLLSNKLDLTMKVLTIFSAVLLPMTVYTNMLAMSASIPFGDHPDAFWIHFCFMLLIASGTVIVFRWRKWF